MERNDEHLDYGRIVSLLQNESFELLKHSSLQNEAYILNHENEHFLFNITLSDELYSIDLDSLISYINKEEPISIELPGLNYKLRLSSIEIIDEYYLLTLVSLKSYQQQINQIRLPFLSAAFVLIVIGVTIAWLTLGKSMQGVLQVTNAADAFASGNLKQRVNYQGQGSEITDLVKHFNYMAAQTEKLIFEMKEVTNNIAHDLRTPVTRMRGLAENTLNENPEDPLAIQVIEECERQAAVIEDILSLAESEAGVLKLNIKQIDLTELITDLLDIYKPLADSQKCSIYTHLPNKTILANIDRHRIQRVLANLLDNAIKYCPECDIEIFLEEENDLLRISVKDNGPGIPDHERTKIFERFYRGDKSRGSSGSGLGLSLAKAYIENHRGELVLEDSSPRTSFLITLPKN